MERRGTHIYVIKFKLIDTPPEVQWTQLGKLRRMLIRLLKDNDFNVLTSSIFTDENGTLLLCVELEQEQLPKIRKHLGPEVGMLNQTEFVNKYVNRPETLMGPYIEGNRWMVGVERRFPHAYNLIYAALKGKIKGFTPPSKIKEAIEDSGFQLYRDVELKEILELDEGFREELYEQLFKRWIWLGWKE